MKNKRLLISVVAGILVFALLVSLILAALPVSGAQITSGEAMEQTFAVCAL